MHFTVYEDDDGSSPFGPANRTPAPLPARLYGRLAETDQHRFEEQNRMVRHVHCQQCFLNIYFFVEVLTIPLEVPQEPLTQAAIFI